MSRKTGPFAKAKVGDWIIDNAGRCAQIVSIEEGELGGVRTGKNRKFFWDGDHHTHRGVTETARMATPQEVAEWLAQQETEQRERDERDRAEEACERIRDAAPELLAACKRAVDFLELDKHAAGDTLARLYAAIAKAESH